MPLNTTPCTTKLTTAMATNAAELAVTNLAPFIARISIAWSIGSARLECLPVQPDRRLHGHRSGEGSVREAAVLSDSHEARDLVRRLIRLDVDLHLDPVATALNGPAQDGALAEEPDHLVDVDLLQLDLQHFPGPGNLGQQSERQRRAEVGQRRR